MGLRWLWRLDVLFLTPGPASVRHSPALPRGRIHDGSRREELRHTTGIVLSDSKLALQDWDCVNDRLRPS